MQDALTAVVSAAPGAKAQGVLLNTLQLCPLQGRRNRNPDTARGAAELSERSMRDQDGREVFYEASTFGGEPGRHRLADRADNVGGHSVPQGQRKREDTGVGAGAGRRCNTDRAAWLIRARGFVHPAAS